MNSTITRMIGFIPHEFVHTNNYTVDPSAPVFQNLQDDIVFDLYEYDLWFGLDNSTLNRRPESTVAELVDGYVLPPNLRDAIVWFPHEVVNGSDRDRDEWAANWFRNTPQGQRTVERNLSPEGVGFDVLFNVDGIHMNAAMADLGEPLFHSDECTLPEAFLIQAGTGKYA